MLGGGGVSTTLSSAWASEEDKLELHFMKKFEEKIKEIATKEELEKIKKFKEIIDFEDTLFDNDTHLQGAHTQRKELFDAWQDSEKEGYTQSNPRMSKEEESAFLKSQYERITDRINNVIIPQVLNEVMNEVYDHFKISKSEYEKMKDIHDRITDKAIEIVSKNMKKEDDEDDNNNDDNNDTIE